jgi:hypothetical protein
MSVGYAAGAFNGVPAVRDASFMPPPRLSRGRDGHMSGVRISILLYAYNCVALLRG